MENWTCLCVWNIAVFRKTHTSIPTFVNCNSPVTRKIQSTKYIHIGVDFKKHCLVAGQCIITLFYSLYFNPATVTKLGIPRAIFDSSILLTSIPFQCWSLIANSIQTSLYQTTTFLVNKIQKTRF